MLPRHHISSVLLLLLNGSLHDVAAFRTGKTLISVFDIISVAYASECLHRQMLHSWPKQAKVPPG